MPMIEENQGIEDLTLLLSLGELSRIADRFRLFHIDNHTRHPLHQHNDGWDSTTTTMQSPAPTTTDSGTERTESSSTSRTSTTASGTDPTRRLPVVCRCFEVRDADRCRGNTALAYRRTHGTHDARPDRFTQIMGAGSGHGRRERGHSVTWVGGENGD